MPRENNTVRVRPIPGERMCFEVESWTDPANPYRVDLLEMMGNGGCFCTDFNTRCIPNHRDNGGVPVNYWDRLTGKTNPMRTRCRHVAAAMHKYLDDHLHDEALKEHRKPKPQPPHQGGRA